MIPYTAVIIAGGGGTRFWPCSRQALPKQLLPITSDQPLITDTQLRLSDSCPAKSTLIITNIHQVEGTRRAVPALPQNNIIAEPVGRNTAPCIGLAALFAQARGGPGALVGIFPADHCITPVHDFTQTLKTALTVAREEGSIVTIGIRPTFAATGYGYIEAGAPRKGTGAPCCRVSAFCEKPDLLTAERFLTAGTYFWNAGMFFARAEVILQELKDQQPDIFRLLERLAPDIDTDRQEEALAAAYAAMPSISFDYAVMERAKRVHMVEALFTWDDVGSWAAVARHLPADSSGNVIRGECIAIDSHNNTIKSQRLVALVGVDDLVVVETEDALLICRRDRAEEVKRVVDTLKTQGRKDLL